jgi:hypothetical protein
MSTSSFNSDRKGGNPPVHSRFKKGQSGNPNGRPKGSKNFKTLLEQALSKTVLVTENGRKVWRTVCELLFQRLAHEGVKGNERAAALLLRTAREYDVGVNEVGQGPSQSEPRDDGALPDPDTLRRIRRRIDDHLRGEVEGAPVDES